jgi:hypothetical protein
MIDLARDEPMIAGARDEPLIDLARNQPMIAFDSLVRDRLPARRALTTVRLRWARRTPHTDGRHHRA